MTDPARKRPPTPPVLQRSYRYSDAISGHIGTSGPCGDDGRISTLASMDEIWTAADCAAHLRVTRSVFLTRTRYVEGFPPPLPWSIGKRLKWDAALVVAWAPKPAGDRRTVLYRHYAADGTLLYVGVSLSHVARLSTHRRKAPWFKDVARIEIQHLPSVAAAKDAERDAIRLERPAYNVAHRR